MVTVIAPVLLLDIFILDVFFFSAGALFIYFYCCMADTLNTEWLSGCMNMCTCLLFVSGSADLSALRAPIAQRTPESSEVSKC